MRNSDIEARRPDNVRPGRRSYIGEIECGLMLTRLEALDEASPPEHLRVPS